MSAETVNYPEAELRGGTKRRRGETRALYGTERVRGEVSALSDTGRRRESGCALSGTAGTGEETGFGLSGTRRKNRDFGQAGKAGERCHKAARRIAEVSWYLLLPAVILVIWEVVCVTGAVPAYSMPSPQKVIAAAIGHIQDGTLIQNIAASFLRVLQGFLIACVFGLGLGIVTGLSRRAERFTELTIQILKPIPPIAWIPLAILWFGIGEASKLFIIFLGAFFPILLNTVSGIHGIDRRYLELARVYEIDRRRLILKIILPGAMPSILTGIRVGLGNAWVCVVAAEMIAATKGIGFMLSNGRSLSRPDDVILGMLLIGIVGKLMDDFLKAISGKIAARNRQ